jgi:hypothetical protein
MQRDRRLSSFIRQSCWKIDSAWLRVLTKISVVLWRLISHRSRRARGAR